MANHFQPKQHYNPTVKRGINKNSTDIKGRQLIPNALMPQNHNRFNCNKQIFYISIEITHNMVLKFKQLSRANSLKTKTYVL